MLESARVMTKSPFPHWIPLTVLTAVALLLLTWFLQTSLEITNGQLAVPLDDAWIHYQFARNLSQGNGFSYNPGEPMPGSTSPLWTVLLASVGLFSTEAKVLMVASLVLSGGFFITAVWLVYGFTLWASDNQLVAFLAALSTALTGRLLWAGLAGMETTAFAALSLGAIWVYSQQGLRPFPVFLFAIASQIRPEGHLLFGLVLADAVVKTQGLVPNKPDILRKLVVPMLLYGIINAPYTLFSLWVTGKLLPNTFYAKAGSEYLFSWRTLQETLALHWQDNPVAFLLIPLGIRPLWQRSRLAAIWLIFLPVMVAFIIDQTAHYGRYTLPLIPLQMVVAALGAQWLWQQIRNRLANQVSFSAVLPAILLTVLLMGGGGRKLPDWARILGFNSQEVLTVDVAAANWLATHTPSDALIAVDDIGAIGFLSGRRLFDLNGLISPEMWPVMHNEPFGRPRNEAATRLLSAVSPDYLVVFPEWHWEIATNPAVVTELTHFTAETKTIIGEQRAFIYQVNQWPYRKTAEPQFPQVVLFGNGIQLLGYDAIISDSIALTLYWQSVQLIGESYDVFIHIIGPNGQLVAQADSTPVAALAPTSRWQPGDIIQDPYTIPLPPDLPTGQYQIRLGLYLRETGIRLPTDDPQAQDNSIQLTTFIIE